MFKQLLINQKKFLDFFFNNIDTDQLDRAFEICRSSRGVLIFTGVGKSGIIAKKITQTLISTGTKAIFLSALDALHGDIGIVGKEDVLIFLSKSGNTQELIDLMGFAKKKEAKIIAVTSNTFSKFAKFADLNIYLPLERELCPFNLAPTTSTTLQAIFGDILAIALMEAKKFSINDYALNHPKGSIGSKISRYVEDVMLKGSQLPIAKKNETLLANLEELTAKKCGCLLIIDNERNLKGIFTDGDLRRSLEKYGDKALNLELNELMTKNFYSIASNALLWQAINKMEENPKKQITVLPVVENSKLVGLIKMHDILQSSI
jgi:arabinose-5-phosphate isomerase